MVLLSKLCVDIVSALQACAFAQIADTARMEDLHEMSVLRPRKYQSN